MSAATKEWYVGYLLSPHWQETRLRKLEAEQYCCERCGFFGRRRRGGVWAGIQVHHKVLCVYCHECEHGRRRRTRDQTRNRYVVGVLEYVEEIDGPYGWD